MMEYVTLNNGVKMPKLGYGVYQVSNEECERCVLDAISVGYRAIDTAQSYGNEEAVGSAIQKCGVPRGELFLTTKVWISNAGYEKAKGLHRPFAAEAAHRLHRSAADSSAVQRLLRHLPRDGGSLPCWQAARHRSSATFIPTA